MYTLRACLPCSVGTALLPLRTDPTFLHACIGVCESFFKICIVKKILYMTIRRRRRYQRAGPSTDVGGYMKGGAGSRERRNGATAGCKGRLQQGLRRRCRRTTAMSGGVAVRFTGHHSAGDLRKEAKVSYLVPLPPRGCHRPARLCLTRSCERPTEVTPCSGRATLWRRGTPPKPEEGLCGCLAPGQSARELLEEPARRRR